jgi:hypothetical protein
MQGVREGKSEFPIQHSLSPLPFGAGVYLFKNKSCAPAGNGQPKGALSQSINFYFLPRFSEPLIRQHIM